MAKSDLHSNSLLPLALVAGILSGSLWRSTPASDGSKSGDAVSGADRADAASPPGPWVSDLRPAMDAIAAALGVSPENPEREGMAYEGGIRLAKAGPARDGQVLDAMKTLRADFDSNLEPNGTTCTRPSTTASRTSTGRPAPDRRRREIRRPGSWARRSWPTMAAAARRGQLQRTRC